MQIIKIDQERANGLCERYRAHIEKATLVVNPGCYATAAIPDLLPAVTARLS